jgi:hypothetical protein
VVGQSSVKPPVQASPSRSPTRPADTGHIEHQILNLGDHVLSGLLGDDFGATALQRVPAARAQRFRPGEHQRWLSSPRVGVAFYRSDDGSSLSTSVAEVFTDFGSSG